MDNLLTKVSDGIGTEFAMNQVMDKDNRKTSINNRKISIKGARVNNLKNIDLDLPLDRFIVITGVSGSGKSSLAFDTLYAEGQRRYVESLSAYARQFLGRMSKPECDYIKGLPPAIAVEQKVNTRNPRSTVGTATEIYDYLRMLFARAGHTFSPVSGQEVRKHGIEDIVKSVRSYPEGTRLAVLIDIRLPEGRDFAQQLDIYTKEGYSRLERMASSSKSPTWLPREHRLPPTVTACLSTVLPYPPTKMKSHVSPIQSKPHISKATTRPS